MLRLFYRALAPALLIGALVTTIAGQEPVSVLKYLAARADHLARSRSPLPDTADAWQAYRSELTGRLAGSLGLPEREPMKAVVFDAIERGDLTFERIAYLWAGRTYATATVIRSTSANGRRPAVVMPSGFLGHHTFLPYRWFVDALARQGLVVMFIDDPRTGGRQAPGAGLYAAASAAGIQVAGIQVFDVLRAFDYLLTRPDIDPGKIGLVGVEEGGLQAYLAAALESRFAFVVAASGTATYQALACAAVEHQGVKDPSAFVAGLLDFADLDRIAACIAPRPVCVAGDWESAGGQAQVLHTMEAVYRLLAAEDRIHEVVNKVSDDLPVDAAVQAVDAICQWLEKRVLPALPSSSEDPLPCGPVEDPDFSMLRHMQRRMDEQAGRLPLPSPSLAAWQTYRGQMIEWLTTACALRTVEPGADQVVAVSETDAVVTERLWLGVDGAFGCPAVLVRPPAAGDARHTAVVLSHDDRQNAASAKIADAARRLAVAGFWVLVPDHASAAPNSLQPLSQARGPRFQGDDAANYYGPADAVGLPPMALRVLEDLAAVRHLAGRAHVAPDAILMAGQGTGGVDACLAAVLDERIAGVVSIDATTLRDWSKDAAEKQLHFFHIMPYLPSLLTVTDWDCVYAAMAPRPLVVIRPKESWSRAGFDQVAATASAIYTLQQAESSLSVLSWRDISDTFVRDLPAGIPKQLIAAAQPLLPTPPQPGTIGSIDGLKSRAAIDSAAGLIWVVAEMAGVEQEFTGGPYTLESWSFFNDNGEAQKGRTITPLILRKQDSQYQVVAIGTPRVNAGTGAQSFAFELAAGSASVGPGHFFGWHTGDVEGQHNPGVVEFDDAADAQMIILTADGAMTDQQLKLGASYREHSRYRRQYSITATARNP